MDNLSRILAGTIILILFLIPVVGCGGSNATATPSLIDTPRPTNTQVLPAHTPVQTATPNRTPVPPTDTPAPSQIESNSLMQALSAMTTDADSVEFTNWAYIREYEGYRYLTSASSEQQTACFVVALRERHAAPSIYGERHTLEIHLEIHPEVWGWNSADLDWEAHLWGSSSHGYVLKFRDYFDLTPVLSRFEERGFTASVHQGATVYTHTLDISQDWLRATEFSILNTAVLTDTNMLFMSIGLQTVHNMLDAWQDRAASLADNPAVQATVGSLGEVGAAIIFADACSVLSSEALLAKPYHRYDAEQLKSQLRDRPQLQPYEALGIGYRYDGTEPVGLVVMQFPDQDQATVDLEPRRQLAVEGLARASNPQTYSEKYFTLNKASVEGSQIILEVTPVEREFMRLIRMIDMVKIRDMTFATCP